MRKQKLRESLEVKKHVENFCLLPSALQDFLLDSYRFAVKKSELASCPFIPHCEGSSLKAWSNLANKHWRGLSKLHCTSTWICFLNRIRIKIIFLMMFWGEKRISCCVIYCLSLLIRTLSINKTLRSILRLVMSSRLQITFSTFTRLPL